jgi:hypothetical protein
MKRVLTLALMASLLGTLGSLSVAGQGRTTARGGSVPRVTVAPAWGYRGYPVYFYRYPNGAYYYYPNGYYFRPYYPPALVISPYGPSYYLPPVIEVTERYFCALHYAGFTTRAGMLDHLAGTHKFSLESAASFCPDGVESCIYPVP